MSKSFVCYLLWSGNSVSTKAIPFLDLRLKSNVWLWNLLASCYFDFDHSMPIILSLKPTMRRKPCSVSFMLSFPLILFFFYIKREITEFSFVFCLLSVADIMAQTSSDHHAGNQLAFESKMPMAWNLDPTTNFQYS